MIRALLRRAAGRRIPRARGLTSLPRPGHPNGSWRGRPPARDDAVGTPPLASQAGCCAPAGRLAIREGTCRGGFGADAPARGSGRTSARSCGLTPDMSTSSGTSQGVWPRGGLDVRPAGDRRGVALRAGRPARPDTPQHRRFAPCPRRATQGGSRPRQWWKFRWRATRLGAPEGLVIKVSLSATTDVCGELRQRCRVHADRDGCALIFRCGGRLSAGRRRSRLLEPHRRLDTDLTEHPQAVVLAARLDDPGQHQVLEHPSPPAA
jgi:hypothetical protein